MRLFLVPSPRASSQPRRGEEPGLAPSTRQGTGQPGAKLLPASDHRAVDRHHGHMVAGPGRHLVPAITDGPPTRGVTRVGGRKHGASDRAFIHHPDAAVPQGILRVIVSIDGRLESSHVSPALWPPVGPRKRFNRRRNAVFDPGVARGCGNRCVPRSRVGRGPGGEAPPPTLRFSRSTGAGPGAGPGPP